MNKSNNKLAIPTNKQLEWQDMEIGVIIHWCAEIYNPGFKDYKTKLVRKEIPTDIINPTNLSPEQWIRSAFELGAKYAVLVANHCTGFSLWPTKENEYSVSSISYMNGKCDVVKEFISACEKYDIKPGLYYSTGVNGWYDINDEIKQDYLSDKYKEYSRHVENQLTELWSNYGKLFEIWFDGGVIPYESGGPNVFGLLNKYQPDAITFQGPINWANNIRWIGNENGSAPDNCWCAYSNDNNINGDPNGQIYCPAESDFPNRSREAFGGGWAWRINEKKYTISPEKLFECYINTVGHNTNMLVGMAISCDGYFDDEQQFVDFGHLLKQTFKNEIKCHVEKNNDVYQITEIVSNPKFIVIQEDLTQGQSIIGYELICNETLIKSGESIGHKRIIQLNESNVQSIKLIITSSITKYEIREIKLF